MYASKTMEIQVRTKRYMTDTLSSTSIIVLLLVYIMHIE